MPIGIQEIKEAEEVRVTREAQEHVGVSVADSCTLAEQILFSVSISGSEVCFVEILLRQASEQACESQ